MENHGWQRALSLQSVVISMLLIIIAVSVVLLVSMPRATESFENVETITNEYIRFENSVYSLRESISELSNRTKLFIATHDMEQINLYFDEKQMFESRRQTPSAVENNLRDKTVLFHLDTIDKLSGQLIMQQEYAMRLVLEMDNPITDMHPLFQKIKLSDEDRLLTPTEKEQKAKDIIFGASYRALLAQIEKQAELYKRAGTKLIFGEQTLNREQMRKGIDGQQRFIILIMVVLLAGMIFFMVFVLKPISRLVSEIRYSQYAGESGAYEIQFLADSYNQFRKHMDEINIKLSYEASHDALTGLYNRKAFEEFLQMNRKRNIALILIDMDHFKNINDSYGHNAGDRVLIRAAYVISHSFREMDRICRIGGDEFAVIMQGVDSSVAETIRNKIAQSSRILEMDENNIPGVTLSVGVAFSDQIKNRKDLFKAADRALYRIKKNGRNGCGFYLGG